MCEPSVISADSLLAQGGRNERLEVSRHDVAGKFAPDGSVSAGQDWFDFTIQDAGGFSASLADAVFVLMHRVKASSASS